MDKTDAIHNNNEVIAALKQTPGHGILHRSIIAIKFVTAVAVASVIGCAGTQPCDTTANSINNDADTEKINDDMDELAALANITAWDTFLGQHNLSRAESEILHPVYEESGDKVLPCIKALLGNKNKSLALLAAYAENPIIDDSVVARNVLGHDNLDTTVYLAMSNQIKFKDDQHGLLRAMNSKNFDKKVFVREYNPYGNKLELIADVLNSPNYNERIFSSLRNIDSIRFHKYRRFLGSKLNELAKKLAIKDPKILFNFEEALLKIRESNKPEQHEDTLAFNYIIDLFGSELSISASTLIKYAVLMNEPDDQEDILRELAPIVASPKLKEIGSVVLENIKDSHFIELLSGVIQNPNFNPSFIPKLKSCAPKTDKYSYALASYLRYQDLSKIDYVSLLIQKYSKHRNADGIMSALSSYFENPNFDFNEISTIINIAIKDDKSDLGKIFSHTKTDKKVISAVKKMVENTPGVEDDELSRRTTVDAMYDLLDNKEFYTWMLDYSLAHGKVSQTMHYLKAVLGEDIMKKVTSYDRSVELARELKLPCGDPVIYTNIAYGIEVFGKEKVKELNKRFGIRFFSRYKPEWLEKMLAPPQNKKTPLFAVYSIEDWNGSSAKAGILSQFEDTFDMTIVETDTETDVFKWLATMKRGVALINAHGFEKSIHIGDGFRETAYIDLNDGADMKRLQSAPPLLILASCATGKNDGSIGAFIAKNLKIKVFAPKAPSSLNKVTLNGSQVESVEYSKSETSIFDFSGTN